MTTPVRHIAVCGGGLAAHMTAAALARQMPESIQISLVDGEDVPASDLMYGDLVPPAAYTFNLAAGVTEPRLILETGTTFSWGTRFTRWGGEQRSWIQCFHQALPIIGGVQFHQYLRRLDIGELEPFLTSGVAARHGAFAHPLEKGPKLLSRAEYGYHVEPQSYRRAFTAAAHGSRVRMVMPAIADIERGADGVRALRLADGSTHEADMYVDCTGADARLISRLGLPSPAGRQLRAAVSIRDATGPGAPCRSVTAQDFGWQSEASLQGRVVRLTVCHPESGSAALEAHGGTPLASSDVTLGRRAEAWSGNCVSIGHAACVVEPLTQAPMLLLQRDIERLLTLIPFSTDMSVERREYNRQSGEDHLNVELFNRALFETKSVSDAPYWRAARAEPIHERLAQKIARFEERGALVMFDLEPFNAEDWTILHFGLGRRAARHDRVADRIPEDEVRQYLTRMRREIEDLAKSLPAHDVYLARLVQYLRQSKR
jgi:tryptophan 7-halogenase